MATNTVETDKLRAYRAALGLVETISDGLDNRTLHLRDKTGRFLRTLDEWVLAVKDGRWPAEELISSNGGTKQ